MSQNDFHPLVLKKDDSFCVYLPEWNISGEGATLDEAYKNFEKRKLATEEVARKYGLGTISREPFPTLKHNWFLREFGLFAAKIATATFAIIFTVILLLPNISASVRAHFLPRLNNALNRFAIDFPTKVNERLDRVTADEQKKIEDEWGKLWNRSEWLRKQMDCKPR